MTEAIPTPHGNGQKIVCPYGACDEAKMCAHGVQVELPNESVAALRENKSVDGAAITTNARGLSTREHYNLNGC